MPRLIGADCNRHMHADSMGVHTSRDLALVMLTRYLTSDSASVLEGAKGPDGCILVDILATKIVA